MKRGYMDWDKNLLPLPALEKRRGLLMKRVAEAGALAAVVYGDVYSADELSYYVNYAPYWCNSVAVLTEQEIYMVTGHNNRVNPWISTLTGLEEEKLLASGFKVPERTARSLKERFPKGGKVAVVGKYVMADVVKELEKQGFEALLMDQAAQDLMDTADESYKNTAAKAAGILREAFEAGDREYEEGGTSKTTAAEIEYWARKNGAMDIAVYVSYKDLEFGVPAIQEDAGRTWTVYALMQYLGVWVSYGKTYGCDTSKAREYLDAYMAEGGIGTSGETGYQVDVRRTVSDAVSGLNPKPAAQAGNRVVSASVWEPSEGTYLEDMFFVTDKGAVVL
ncbi:hypothetical protein DW886_01020 [Enterocloster aldenensis]|uniref:hypothetical protein n=1 Tax=Enterocloster aldenensis TaxID=358742 RepID=UPI000E5519F2|nr:hypothetical protein DW886_01020 [Enterocloster aldenensis]